MHIEISALMEKEIYRIIFKVITDFIFKKNCSITFFILEDNIPANLNNDDNIIISGDGPLLVGLLRSFIETNVVTTNLNLDCILLYRIAVIHPI